MGTDLDRHFTAQIFRPSVLRPLVLGTLQPHHRVMLLSDGLTTTTLEAWWNEPVRVRCVHHRFTTGPLTRWLHVTDGEEVTLRRVISVGVHTGNPLIRAETLYVPTRLPEAWRDQVEENGVGPTLAARKVETRRELLWYGRPPGAIAGRTYRIFSDGEPIFLITEEFVR